MAGGRGAFDTGGNLTGADIAGSQVENGVVLVAVEVNDADKGTGEAVYGSVGSGGRVLPPNADGKAEAICARADSGDMPVLAARDIRIETALDEPAEGTIYKAGYYGARLRFDVVNGEARSVVSLSDGKGRELVIDADGVRVPSSPLIQGDTGAAKDVALAEPLIDVLGALFSTITSIASALSGLGAPIDISNLTMKMAPYLAGGSPSAPTTRAPDLRGEPGA